MAAPSIDSRSKIAQAKVTSRSAARSPMPRQAASCGPELRLSAPACSHVGGVALTAVSRWMRSATARAHACNPAAAWLAAGVSESGKAANSGSNPPRAAASSGPVIDSRPSGRPTPSSTAAASMNRT